MEKDNSRNVSDFFGISLSDEEAELLRTPPTQIRSNKALSGEAVLLESLDSEWIQEGHQIYYEKALERTRFSPWHMLGNLQHKKAETLI
jgi:hypothetical protein